MKAPELAARDQLETAKRELEDARGQHTRLQASCETASRALSSAPKRWRPPATVSSAAARSCAGGSRCCPRGSSSTKLKTTLAWTPPRAASHTPG